MLELLTYPPILKGLIVLLFAGISFPITGLYLLKLNLLPLRFMLMHGAIFGGALALAMQLNPMGTTILVNLMLVLFMTRASRTLRVDAGQMSTFFMVITISLAFILIYKFNVPAKDTLSILWGSLYTLSWYEVAGVVIFSLMILAFQLIFNRQLQAIFFFREIAFTAGVNENAIHYAIVIITALTVATAMKLIGALLLDAILLLPALITAFKVKSFHQAIIWSSLCGGIFAIAGFFLSLAFDIPASSSIAVLASVVFISFVILAKK